jgi:LysM repeat protein
MLPIVAGFKRFDACLKGLGSARSACGQGFHASERFIPLKGDARTYAFSLFDFWVTLDSVLRQIRTLAAMLKRMLSVVAVALFAASGFAASSSDSPSTVTEAELRDDHPQTYTVVRGDTLWDISARFLKSPWLWPEIWQANSQIENPHLIYPGDVISLVYVDGQPQLVRGRPDTVKLSPRVRASGTDGAITAVPLNLIKPFLEKMRVLTESDAKDLPYLVSAEESRILSAPGQVVYVRNLDARPGDEVDIVRATVVYRDVPRRFYRWGEPKRAYEELPYSGVKQKTFGSIWNDWSRDLFRKSKVDTLGHEVVHVARARVLRTGDPSTLLLLASDLETMDGDVVVPVDASPYDATYMPHAPQQVPDNMRVLAVSDANEYAGPMRVVAMSRGAREGVENGQVYSLFQPGEKIRDNVKYAHDDLRTTFTDRKANITIPEEFLGHVMVFRTFEKVSYGLVMNGIRPVKVHDMVRAPQSLEL